MPLAQLSRAASPVRGSGKLASPGVTRAIDLPIGALFPYGMHRLRPARP